MTLINSGSRGIMNGTLKRMRNVIIQVKKGKKRKIGKNGEKKEKKEKYRKNRKKGGKRDKKVDRKGQKSFFWRQKFFRDLLQKFFYILLKILIVKVV